MHKTSIEKLLCSVCTMSEVYIAIILAEAANTTFGSGFFPGGSFRETPSDETGVEEYIHTIYQRCHSSPGDTYRPVSRREVNEKTISSGKSVWRSALMVSSIL